MTTLLTQSTFALTNLALQSAIELERFKAGMKFDKKPLKELADALVVTSHADAPGEAFRFVEPGYYEPFERLYLSREAKRSNTVTEIQAFIREASKRIANAAEGRGSDAAKLIEFCLALHQELIQEFSVEDAFAVQESRQHAKQGSSARRRKA
ncbi:MAG: hypothetical protein K2X57_11640 [Xanthobacteraceae bacterium]|nr:hypothetical protein [Xanthobacteraceae bacterium]